MLMPIFLESIIILLIILMIARFIKRGSGILQKLFIPSALVAGFAGLILGPQVLGTIPKEITDVWASLPKYLISIVFAGLFLGKTIPKLKDIWRTSGSMIAFGNTIAWGQYVLGILLTVFILVPFFNANPLSAALIEISFEGGHGTAAGLAPTFEQLGWPQGTDIALGLATFSIIAAIFSGIIIINVHNRKITKNSSTETFDHIEKQMIKSGYNLVGFTNKFNTNPKAVLINIIAFVVAIFIGWVLLKGLVFLEDLILSPFTDIRFFEYLPLFPLAMLGGLIVQLFLKKIHKSHLIQRRTAAIISSLALDLLIASAIATISLQVIGDNIPIFVTFAIAGVVWILGCFFVLAPKMFKINWFENGITNIGQSMGMTATGLLMNRLADPSNKTKAKEVFAYKQLAFEPFMGGGIITVASVIVIYEFGLLFAFITSFAVMIFWLIVGYKLGKK